MSPATSPNSGTRARTGGLPGFWQRISEGRQLDELWSQFTADARASYGFYMRESGAAEEEMVNQRGRPRFGHIVKTLFWSLVMKLTPARRVLLIIACALLLVSSVQFKFGKNAELDLNFTIFSVLVLLLLLALELADKVTMKRDLEIAREMQRMLVPQSAPSVDGIDIAFATRPANTVAGDYYDAFLRAGGKSLMLFVADVAGKGIPSGLLMARFEASVHLLCDESAPLKDVMERLNRTIWERSGGGRHFITCFAAELDVESRALTWVSAGHNPPLIVRASGKVEKLAQGGLPLGMFPAARYEAGHGELQHGDWLVIYTDGVTEANDTTDAEFGDARLEKLAQGFGKTPAAECMKRLFTAVDAFAGTAPQADDITCLLLRVAAAQKAGSTN